VALSVIICISHAGLYSIICYSITLLWRRDFGRVG